MSLVCYRTGRQCSSTEQLLLYRCTAKKNTKIKSGSTKNFLIQIDKVLGTRDIKKNTQNINDTDAGQFR